MATIVGKRSNAAKDPMQAALAEFRGRLSLATVRDSLSASRYAVSSVNPGGTPSLVGAQVTGATQGVPKPSTVIGTAPVSVTQSGSQFDVSLTASGVAAGTYGDATHVGKFTVDALGRIIAASNVAFTSGGGSPVAVKTVTAPYTIAAADVPAASSYRGAIAVNSSSSTVVTIDAFANTAIPVGSEITFFQEGTGAVTIGSASGVTLLGVSITGGGKGGVGRAIQIAQDVWVVDGQLAFNASAGDPYWANVVSLMYFNGTNGSTTFTDEVSGVTWTSSGGAQISTAQSKFGGSSLLIGSTGILHTTAAIPALGVAYTIEGWVYVPNTASGVFVENGTAWPNFIVQASGGTQYSNGSTWLYSSGTAIAADTWTHIAISATDANHVYSFINGVLVGTGTTGPAAAYNLYIGQNSSGGQQCNGYIDCVRVTAGVGRYTASFTPPTAPFPNHA